MDTQATSSPDSAPLAPDLHTVPADASAAASMLETLRQQRLDDRVGEQDYLSRSDYLARFASGEKVEPPPGRFVIDNDTQAKYDEWMQPPENGG